MRKIQNKYIGPILGVLIFVLIIVSVGLYFFATHISTRPPTPSVSTGSDDKRTDISSLKADLNNAIR
jgi:hypothetical protein